jgi:hypothetical protein
MLNAKQKGLLFDNKFRNLNYKLYTMELSSLLNRFSEPETLKMAKLGRELRAQGIDVIDLSLSLIHI